MTLQLLVAMAPRIRELVEAGSHKQLAAVVMVMVVDFHMGLVVAGEVSGNELAVGEVNGIALAVAVVRNR